MADAMLNIRLIQPRLMELKHAAEYIGVKAKLFSAICPVTPTLMPGDVKLYDRVDLDEWIDQVKAGAADTDDDILGRLA